MRLGVANNETWIFLQEIYDYLAQEYPTLVFKPATWPFPFMTTKMSHYLFRRSLKQFIQQCDVVLFEWASQLLLEASQMKASSDAALVTRLHRYEMYEWVNKINWDAVSYVILDTQTMRNKLLQRISITPEKTIVIPPVGILEEKFCLDPRPFNGRIGILCDLSPRKRVYELILAFYSIVKSLPDLRLYIGGNSSPAQLAYYEALHFLTKKLGIIDKVEFQGRIVDRWHWYQSIDIFISNSYSEGMQVAPLEASANGCYCISHWWEGSDEIFPITDLYFTEDEFINKVINYCNATENQRVQMRAPMIEFVTQNCSHSNVCNQVKDVIQRAKEN